MSTYQRLLLAAAVLIAPLTSTNAQTPLASSGPAIYVSEFEVTDAEGMKPYSAGVDATFAPYGGRYIVRGGEVISREGAPSKRIVMIEFPSMAQAQAWYDSPTYAALRPVRQKASTARVYIVQGTPR